jgi:hypothetical protein
MDEADRKSGLPVSTPVQASQATQPAQHEDYSKKGWGEVLTEGAGNFLPSAGNLIKNTASAVFQHPIETAKGIGQIGTGALSKIQGALGEQQDPEEKASQEAVLNSIWDHYKDQYGSEEGFKRAVATDPASIAMDIGSIAVPSLGTGLKAAGIGETALRAVNAARMVDPIQAATRLSGRVASGVVNKGIIPAVTKTQSIASGVPTSALDLIRTSAEAAKKDPAALEAVQRGIATGGEGAGDALDMLDRATAEAHQTASAKFAADAPSLRTAPLPMNKIVDALDDLHNAVGYNPVRQSAIYTTGRNLNQINEVTRRIRAIQADPSLTTAERLHVLKKSIDEAIGGTEGTTKNQMQKIRSSVSETIKDAAPQYENMMQGWMDLMDQIKNIRSGFGSDKMGDANRVARLLKSMANPEKMQILRGLSGTPSGKYLPHLIAGKLASDWLPSSSYMFKEAPLAAGLAYALHPGLIPAAAAGAAMGSPRLAAMSQMAMGRIAGSPVMGAIAAAPTIAGEYSGRTEDGYKRGGAVRGHDASADRLVREAERAKKALGEATEPLLQRPDEEIVKALTVANRSI